MLEQELARVNPCGFARVCNSTYLKGRVHITLLNQKMRCTWWPMCVCQGTGKRVRYRKEDLCVRTSGAIFLELLDQAPTWKQACPWLCTHALNQEWLKGWCSGCHKLEGVQRKCFPEAEVLLPKAVCTERSWVTPGLADQAWCLAACADFISDPEKATLPLQASVPSAQWAGWTLWAFGQHGVS